MVNFDVIRDIILIGEKGDESSVVNVHTERTSNEREREGERYLLLPKPRSRYKELHFSFGGD